MSAPRVESERPDPGLQASLRAAVDSDRRRQQPQVHQDCPFSGSLRTRVWRVSCIITKARNDVRLSVECRLPFCLLIALLLLRLLSGLSPIQGLRAVVREAGSHQLLEVRET